MGGFGDDDPGAAVAGELVIGAHEEQPREFPGRARRRLQRRRRHAGDRAERLLELDEHPQPTLRSRRRRGGMDVAESRERRRLVADLRVVLHRARAERVSAEIDAVLAVREPGHVPDEVAFRDLGKGHRRHAEVLGGHELLGGPLRQARRAERPRPTPGGRQLEDRRFGRPPEQRRRGRAPAGRRPVAGHRTAPANALAKPSISALVRRSVTATRSPPSASVPSNPSRSGIPAR